MNVSLRITLIYKGITLDVHSCGFRQHRNYQNKLKSSISTREREFFKIPAPSGNFSGNFVPEIPSKIPRKLDKFPQNPKFVHIFPLCGGNLKVSEGS